ncbi:uncharacterized protein LOC129743831 [Uranotaenia lowii]|uniref:uncharacterized protein LOC129743831 n=1 Tax=Uranotaenia lowii TaxID=190385 RepID=UPI002478F0E4|nr:uncharacterized protein LOC129743831 [Uranotaenia lowii]
MLTSAADMLRPHQLNPSRNIREKMRIFEQDASLDSSAQRRRYSDTSALLLAGGGGGIQSAGRHHYHNQNQRSLGECDLIGQTAPLTFVRNPNSNNNDPTSRMMPPINGTSANGSDSQGLIMPKKLVNPCVESMDRQNLHRELMFNQKMGKNVLNQKSELQRALEKQKERQILAAQNLAKQQAQEQSIANELGRVIMQRAARLEQKNAAAAAAGSQDGGDGGDSINPEYLMARSKLRATTAAAAPPAVYSK